MRQRSRWILFVLLLIAGLGGAAVAWSSQGALTALAGAEAEVGAGLARMRASAAAIGAAQQAYVAPGQPDAPWMEQAAAGLQDLANDAAAIRPHARSPQAAGALQNIAERIAAVVEIDARTRESLAAGQELQAADLIYSDARGVLGAIATDVSGLEQTERAAFDAERTALHQRTWGAAGAWAAAWLIGLALLVKLPARASEPPAPALPGVTRPDASDVIVPPEAPAPAPIDLAAAADLCTAISRATAAVQLPDLLARAAAVLDASGLIVWMSAGEELFAVTAHGYDPRVINRLGPIGRDADNATAACWRTGEIAFVPGDALTNGAIVAPLFGPQDCIGVLAIEVRHERERDAATRAVAAMIAAQLATVVVAWPPASSAPPSAAAGNA
jgi:hypothetical protein